MQQLVDLDNVSVTAGGHRALAGVTLNIRSGEHLALFGANGAGKSTLLRVIRGTAYPDARHGGRIFWLDESAGEIAAPAVAVADDTADVLADAFAADTAVDPATYTAVDPATALAGSAIGSDTGSDVRTRMDDATLTGRALTALVSAAQQERYARIGQDMDGQELILSGMFQSPRLYQEPEPVIRKNARLLAERLGAGNLLDAPLPTLSQGQLRILLVARALIRRPRLLLLDEVCEGLDATARQTVLDVLDMVASDGTTLVFATHRLDEMPVCIRRWVQLDGGRIVASGCRDSAPVLAGAHPDVSPPPPLFDGQLQLPDAKARLPKAQENVPGAEESLPGTPESLSSTQGNLPSAQMNSPLAKETSSNSPAPKSIAGHTAKAPAEARPLLVMEKVTVFVDRVPVLHDIDWVVRRGEQWAVTGANGAGKSTLLRLIAGEEFAAAGGDVRLMPDDSDEPARGLLALRRHVSIVSDRLQAHYAYDITAMDCVLSGIEGHIGLYGTPAAHDMERARHWLAFLDLSEIAERRIRTLSTGQLRRVLLARALMAKPLLLLLDEPCSGLDDASRRQFLHLLGKLVRCGVHLIMVSHHDEDIIPEITHTLRLADGRALTSGPRQNGTAL